MITADDCHPNMGLKASQLENWGAEINSLLFGVRNVFWVNSTHVDKSDTAYAGTRDNPFGTIAYAVTKAVADSAIVCDFGHAETLTGDDVDIAAAGLRIISLGQGSKAATLTYGTNTTAKFLVDQVNTSLFGLRHVVAKDALAVMLDLKAAYCRILRNTLILDDSSTEALIGISLSDVASDYCEIAGCYMESATVGANSAIKIAAACNGANIHDNRVIGDFADACIHNPTGNVATLVDVGHNHLTNLQSGDHAIEFVSAVTGVIHHNVVNSTLAAVGTKTAIDPGSCFCIENYGSDGVGDVSGVINPAYDA